MIDAGITYRSKGCKDHMGGGGGGGVKGAYRSENEEIIWVGLREFTGVRDVVLIWCSLGCGYSDNMGGVKEVYGTD